MDTLNKALRARINDLTYQDLVGRRPSGMTKLQEWFRKHGMKEVAENDPWDEKTHVRLDHPVPWTLEHRTMARQTRLLLVPKELALKIETLGFVP